MTLATPDYTSVLGARVLSIGGKTPAQMLADVTPYVSYENETERRLQAADLIRTKGMLQHLNMVDSDGNVAMELESPSGEVLNLKVRVTPRGDEMRSVADGLHTAIPLYLSRTNTYYWYRYLADSRTLYIQYNVCENDPKQRFGDFASQALSAADAQAIKRVVIDLRRNGGGNSRVISPLKSGLASRLKSLGHVYVLIGPLTFSSAVDNAEELRKALSATLVGEPTGGMPGGYGEVSTLTLPNSKLVVRYTTRHESDKENGPTSLMPDLAAPIRLGDFVAGRDPGLEAAIHAR